MNTEQSKNISISNNAEIEDAFKLLREGEERIELSESKDAILVLGNTGAGKSTLALFLTEAELVSIRENGGTYLIKDMNEKISSGSTVKSKTVFPELMVDNKTSTALYDCPGFSDTRSTSYDIAATYFIKKVADHLESVKLIFVVNHTSLIKGNDRHDFMRLAKHVTNLVKDIEKFKDSIILVATKVNSISECNDDGQCILVPDNEVINGVADFLQEVKQLLGRDLGSSNISSDQKGVYESTIKFIDILLAKDGEDYTRIGIFRRPNKLGPLINIPLLQKAKGHIENILHKKLNFIEKDHDDFGYTISEQSKNDLNSLVEKINENVTSSVSSIVVKLKDYYNDVVDQIRNKIESFDTGTSSVNQTEAQLFSTKLSLGKEIVLGLVEETKNLTAISELEKRINSSLTTLGINTCEDDLLTISNQGKYFEFLQTVSDKELSIRWSEWEALFQNVKINFSNANQMIQNDINGISAKINGTVSARVRDIAQEIEKYYQKKMNFIEVQKLPSELNEAHGILLTMVEEIKDLNNAQELAKKLRDNVIKLGIDTPGIRGNMLSIFNQGKYLKFLQIISDKALNTWSPEWVTPFNGTVTYLQKSEKWYKFLGDLYIKFSEYEIQKATRKYNVANIENWGDSSKARGIFINQANFKQFLDKVRSFHIEEHDAVSTIEASESQLRELNHVLDLTLKQAIGASCPTQNKLVIKGDYIKFSDFLEFNGKLKNLCASRATLDSLDVFSLNTVFIDKDLNGMGDKLKVTVIAPKWEIIGDGKITLDGAPGIAHSSPKASNGVYAESRGEDGKPGLPGGYAGSFFGIGTEFINSRSLTITANGGKGGPGQDGGDGSTWKNGIDAQLPSIGYIAFDYTSPCKKVGEILSTRFVANKHVANTGGFVYVVKIDGTLGYKGGNGGDGGKGGIGGNSGKITLINLKNTSLPSKIEVIKGNDGYGGYEGRGGSGSRHGNSIKAECYPWSLLEEMYAGHASSGMNGANNANNQGMQFPESASIIQNPVYIINAYKSYLREELNVNSRFKKYPFIEFLNELDNNGDVKNIYNTLGLVQELTDLEKQSHLFSKENLIIFYQSILDRINAYAKNPTASESSAQYKKVLSYLYTATLSRLYNLKTDSEPNLIIDIAKYLESVEKNIEALKILREKNNKVNVINQYKEHYKANIDEKIGEARQFIETQITNTIDDIGVKIDNKIDLLIDETLELQAQAKKEKQDLINKKRELQNALALRSIFSIFKIVGQVTSFLGPMGTAAGATIGAASTITESLVLDNQTGQGRPLQLPSGVTSDLKLLEAQIKITKDKKVSSFNKQLERIAQEISPHSKLSDVFSSVANIQKEVKEMLNLDGIDFEVFDKIEKLDGKLKEELKAKERELKTQKAITDQSTANAIAAITKVNQVVQLGIVGFDIYSKYKSDQVKLDKISDEIRQSEEKFKSLKEFESKIYSTVAPMLKTIQNDLKDVESKLGTKSKVALDVTKWQVQGSLKDIRLQMQQLTEGFKVKDSLIRYIEKLEEAMTTLINIYDRIQSYQEQQNLANYIADISSSTANRIGVTDINLSNTINHLEIIIRSNLILEQYETAMNALKQWVFPCADSYLSELKLPQHLELNSDVISLADSAISRIATIKLKVDAYKTLVRDGDKYIHRGEFSSNYISSRPFFVWENEIYKMVLSQLLSGQEVVLKAEVTNTPYNQDAIKFNWIGINLKSANETLQAELHDTLKGFQVNATHLGNSYYRYNDKIYTITSPSLTITYNLEKNDKGDPIFRSDTYSKLKTGDLMLSPYAMWKFKLINATDRIFFDRLEKYQDQVNLELIGHGSYVNRNACPKVEDYYKADDTYNAVTWRSLDAETTNITNSTTHSPEQTRKKRHIEPDEPNTNEKGLGGPVEHPFRHRRAIPRDVEAPVVSSAIQATSWINQGFVWAKDLIGWRSRGRREIKGSNEDLNTLVTNKRLEEFIGYFVKEFEARLIAYCIIVEEEIKKTEGVWQELGVTACGFEKLFLLNEKDNFNKPQNILYASNLNIHSKNKIVTFRQRLIEAGFDIFQSFEMQFMRVTVGQGDKGPIRAMHKLARDAVDRAMNYIKENGGILIENGDILIAESILFGKSKEKVVSTEAPHVSEHVEIPGFKINYAYQSNKVVWNTASLFDKAGLVVESRNSFFPHTYYKSKNEQSDTSKYGYRRLFILENLYKLGEGYEEDSVEGNKRQFTNYTYLISPEKLKEKSRTMLDHLNCEDNKLSDTRIKAIFEEAKQTILKEISDLKGQCPSHVIYCSKLENIEANLNNLNVDNYLSKFDPYFKEMQKNQIDALKKALLMKDKEGRTPLHKATFGMEGQQSVRDLLWHVKDQPDFLQELLRVQDDKGRTPLHMAAWWGRQQAVNELLEDIKTQSNFLQELLLIQDENGGTSLHVAARNDREPIIGLLLDGVKDQPDFLKKLFLIKDKIGRTPLHVAVTAAESVKELLKYVEGQLDFLKELLLMQEETGKTPLHVAVAQYGSKVVVELLLENGANANAEDNGGKTPMHLAAQTGQIEIVKLLKEKGADIQVKDSNGNTPLSLATRNNHPSVAQYLRSKGARSRRSIKDHVKLAELNTNEKGQKGLQLLTILPHHQSSLHNNMSQAVTQGFNSSQTEPKPQTTTSSSYCQIEIVESYVVLKWLCGLFGKHSMVANLNKVEKINQGEITTHPLDEIESRFKRSMVAYGNESVVFQKQLSPPAGNRVSSSNPLLFFKALVTQSTDKINSISNKTLLVGMRK